jgi:hypothetical protein
MVVEVAKRGAQPFLNDRMIEGSFEQFGDGEPALDRPGEEMSEMFRRWTEDFGAKQQPARPIAIDAQQSPVEPQYASPSLVFERHFADGEIHPVAKLRPAMAIWGSVKTIVNGVRRARR